MRRPSLMLGASTARRLIELGDAARESLFGVRPHGRPTRFVARLRPAFFELGLDLLERACLEIRIVARDLAEIVSAAHVVESAVGVTIGLRGIVLSKMIVVLPRQR